MKLKMWCRCMIACLLFSTMSENLAQGLLSGGNSLKPKSVIRHAESVFDWESEAFGHLARLCPHPDSRYAST